MSQKRKKTTEMIDLQFDPKRCAKVGNLYIEEVLITPEIAAGLLRRNAENNRRVNAGKVRDFALEIQENRWLLTHQGIAIDTNDRLIDGQTRLSAIIRAGKPAVTLVCWGCDPATVPVLDGNSVRKANDIYAFLGGGTDADAMAACRIAASMLRGVERGAKTDNRVVADLAFAHRSLILSLSKRLKDDRQTYCAGLVAAFCAASLEHGRAPIERLVKKYAGEEWEGAQPLRWLRNWIIEQKKASKKGGHLQPWAAYAMAASAIRATISKSAFEPPLEPASEDFNTSILALRKRKGPEARKQDGGLRDLGRLIAGSTRKSMVAASGPIDAESLTEFVTKNPGVSKASLTGRFGRHGLGKALGEALSSGRISSKGSGRLECYFAAPRVAAAAK